MVHRPIPLRHRSDGIAVTVSVGQELCLACDVSFAGQLNGYSAVSPANTKPKITMTATSTRVRPIAIKIDQDIRDRVKCLAEARQRTSHWLMREAIAQYVEREEKREGFRQDAIKAWKDYQETGLHVTGDEAMAWLETWGEDNETSAPICHT